MVQKVLKAIFTIGAFLCSFWPPYHQDSRSRISSLDRPIDTPAWNGLAARIGLALFNAHIAEFLDETARPEPGPRLKGPTWREVERARQSRIARRLADQQYMAVGPRQWPIQPTR